MTTDTLFAGSVDWPRSGGRFLEDCKKDRRSDAFRVSSLNGEVVSMVLFEDEARGWEEEEEWTGIGTAGDGGIRCSEAVAGRVCD